MAPHVTNTLHKDERAPRRANIVLIGFLLVGGFYLVTEHRAHMLGLLPFLFLPLCLVMHFFMHGKHGHGGGHRAGPVDGASPETPALRAPTGGAGS
jgi:hypothetical protein